MNFRKAIALSVACGSAITGSLLTATSAYATEVVGCPTNGVNVFDFSTWQGHRTCYADWGSIGVYLVNPFEAWSPWNRFVLRWTSPGGNGDSGIIDPGQTYTAFPSDATIYEIDIEL